MIELDVLDALEAFELVGEDPLLGGSVPQRAAQGCSPLLEGNAIGLQLKLMAPVHLRRTLTGLTVDEAFAAKCRVMAPALVARGLITPEMASAVAAGLTYKRGRARMFTGLFVRPPDGVKVLVRGGSARATRSIVVEAQRIDAAQGAANLAPLFIEFKVQKGLAEARMEGTVATLLFLPSRAPELIEATGPDRTALVRSHASFYDEAYFAAKQEGKLTKKYKRLANTLAANRETSTNASITLAQFGPRLLEQAGDGIVVRAAFRFRARYDGSLVHIEADAKDRARFAESVEADLTMELQAIGHTHQGARLYFSKYFTPHPAGEPHFFVKPPALVGTAPGWSTLVEGSTWAHCRTMRGVVRTDSFGAVPQVFEVFAPFQDITFEAGEALCTLHPIPRSLMKVVPKVVPMRL